MLNKGTLQGAILGALNSAQSEQEGSSDPRATLAEKLATAIDDFVRSAQITPEKFDVAPGSIVTVGGASTQTGPAGPVPLNAEVVTLGDMN